MNKKNLAITELTADITNSATQIIVSDGSILPDAPFRATLQPLGETPNSTNSEIITITAKAGNVLTATRNVGGTQLAFQGGSLLVHGFYVEDLAEKQDTLISGTTIKTINNNPVLGSGNIATPNTTYSEIPVAEITAGTASTGRTISGRRAQEIVNKARTGLQETLVSGTNIKTINGNDVIGSGNITTPNTTYSAISTSEIDAGTATTARAITGQRSKYIIDKAKAGLVASDTTAKITVSETEPTSPQDGDIWVDESDGEASPTLSDMLDFFYPIGTVYINGVNDTNPGAKLGGVWEPYAQGRAIVGLAESGTFSTLGGEMGAETHTLTTGQMPTHSFYFTVHGQENGSDVANVFVTGGTRLGTVNNSKYGNHNYYTNSTSLFNPGATWGLNQAHNNIQPTKVAAAWIRIS